MRYAWLLVCITIQVCTTTSAEALHVELVAPVPDGKCMHNIHSRSLPGPGMHGRGPPCMPPGPRQASLILLFLYAHLNDWPAKRQADVYRLNASNGYWRMGPDMQGNSPPCLPLGSPASPMLLYTEEAQTGISHAHSYPDVRRVSSHSYMFSRVALRENGASCKPLCPLSHIVYAPACPGPVTLTTLRPLTPRAREMYAQLRQPPVGQASISQEQIIRLANNRPGSLLLASLGDSKASSRQHPAITGFSVSNPPTAVTAICLQAVAETGGTVAAHIAPDLIAAVESATGVKGPLTARRIGGTARPIWVDEHNPARRVLAVDWEIQAPGGQDFALRAMEPRAAIAVPKYEADTGNFVLSPATVKPAPFHTSQLDGGRGVEYLMECTAGGIDQGEELVKEVLTKAARIIFEAETGGYTQDSFPHTTAGVATAMTALGLPELQLLGVEAVYSYSRQQTVKVIHGHAMAAAFIAEVGGLDIRVMGVGLALTPAQQGQGPGPGPGPGSQLHLAVELRGFPTGSIVGDPHSQHVVLQLLAARVESYLQQAQTDPDRMGLPTGSTLPTEGRVYLRDVRSGKTLPLQDYALLEEAEQAAWMAGVLADGKGRPLYSLSPTQLEVGQHSSQHPTLLLSLADPTSNCILLQAAAYLSQPLVMGGMGMSMRPWGVPGAEFMTSTTSKDMTAWTVTAVAAGRSVPDVR